MTKVVNLSTEESFFYMSDLSPAEAVRNAYASTITGNTWDWERLFPVSNVRSRQYGRKTVYSMGDFSAVVKEA